MEKGILEAKKYNGWEGVAHGRLIARCPRNGSELKSDRL